VPIASMNAMDRHSGTAAPSTGRATLAILLTLAALCGCGSGKGTTAPPARVLLIGGNAEALGQAYRSDDLGVTWERVVNPGSNALAGPVRPWFTFRTRDVGYGIADTAATLVGSSDGGIGWRPLPSSPPLATDASSSRITAVGFFDAEHGVAITNTLRSLPGFSTLKEYALFATSDGGSAWTPVTHGQGALPSALCVTSAGLGVAFGSRVVSRDGYGPALLASRDRGATWRSILPPNSPVGMTCTGAATVWVATELQLLRSNDAGASWDDRTAILPEGVNPVSVRSLTFTSEDDGALLAGSYLEPGQQIGLTRDGGARWEWLPVPAPVGDLVAIDARTLLIVAGGTRGALLATRDGGRSWSGVTLPAGVETVDVIQIAHDPG